ARTGSANQPEPVSLWFARWRRRLRERIQSGCKWNGECYSAAIAGASGSNPGPVVISNSRSNRQSRICTGHRRRWSIWLSSCALAALAWPSLGPLPWVIVDFDGHRHAGAGHHHAGEALHHDDHFDGSSIPGSPTHPIDHDCPECQVLKHLSRCVLPVFAVSVIPPPFICDVPPRVSVALPPTRITAHLPPVRAPPEATA
ncbi:MAG TPA: hypothetical protein VKU81_13295, partial [Casimicrobiaceae bacterium]|nr:hypothetical protein [Casimicrobiaceae bacterium]